MMAKKEKPTTGRVGRREYGNEIKEEAVQMLLDDNSAASVIERLGISNTNVLYR